jgi:hypothetical protein
MDLEEIIRLLDYVLRRLKSNEPNRVYPSRPEELYVLGADLIIFGQMVQNIGKKQADELIAKALHVEDKKNIDSQI